MKNRSWAALGDLSRFGHAPGQRRDVPGVAKSVPGPPQERSWDVPDGPRGALEQPQTVLGELSDALLARQTQVA